MDKDRVEETAKQVSGSGKEEIRTGTANESTETEGKGDQADGEASRRIVQAEASLSRHVQRVMPVQRRSPASVRQSRKAP